jgi:hypothetical protein
VREDYPVAHEYDDLTHCGYVYDAARWQFTSKERDAETGLDFFGETRATAITMRKECARPSLGEDVR